jgi:hypothetical protein
MAVFSKLGVIVNAIQLQNIAWKVADCGTFWRASPKHFTVESCRVVVDQTLSA